MRHLEGFAALGLALVVLPAGDLVAQHPEAEETVVYQLALLVEGTDRKPVTEGQAQRLQSEHLEFLSDLMRSGKAILAGPVEHGRKLAGAVVLDVAGPEEAQKILAADPWIENGRLVAEIHPWRTTRDRIPKVERFEDLQPAGLGLLIEAPIRPRFKESYLTQVEEGHRDYLRQLVEEGDAALYGSFEDKGTLRGTLVFYTDDAAEIRDLTEDDPAIDEGLIRLDLVRWYLPGNSLPVPADDEEDDESPEPGDAGAQAPRPASAR